MGKFSSAIEVATASEADNPDSRYSSTIGPRAGLVTFCVATAPTPALAKAQRAATAGEDEEIANPNCPVSAHFATIEKVTLNPSQSGITKVASISTSHSGRAKAVTHSPVETGYIPFRYSPIVLYTASRWRVSVI